MIEYENARTAAEEDRDAEYRGSESEAARNRAESDPEAIGSEPAGYGSGGFESEPASESVISEGFESDRIDPEGERTGTESESAGTESAAAENESAAVEPEAIESEPAHESAGSAEAEGFGYESEAEAANEVDPESTEDELESESAGSEPAAAGTDTEAEPWAGTGYEPVPEPGYEAVSESPAGVGSTDFAERMSAIQLTFIDDPRQAAVDADDLLAEALQAFADDMASRRRELDAASADGAAPDTEHLRLAVRRSREIVELLSRSDSY
ncbi:MAG TPA: hypothetical protein VH372_01790 [Actinospica sp.]|nr:hypothetical protein [Actinospica sp.]